MQGSDDQEAQREPRRACGLYRTTEPLEDKVPAGALVYYHNHGDPGPGVYPVERWINNKALFARRGTPVAQQGWERTLEPLPAEGFYRVVEEFHCCEKRCRRFEPGQLVQLGYDGQARPLLFTPIWRYEGLTLPAKGTRVSSERLALLERVKVVEQFEAEASGPTAPVDPDQGYLH